MTKQLIVLEGLRKVFLLEDVETRALTDVDLSVAEGEFVSIEGPSGCGKSTLLSVLGLLDPPSGGTYLLNGHDVSRLSPDACAHVRNRHIGFVFQTFNLIGDLTVTENVELPLIYRGLGKGDRRRRAASALERVGMASHAKNYPAQLSGGQQQRVAVARAVVGEPALVLADEPTGNLDSANGEAILQLLLELHRAGATVCMVTHSAEHAAAASRRICLRDGLLVRQDATA